MKTAKIVDKIKSIPNGQFFRIRYISKCKMNAENSNKGYTLFKIVDTTTRTGCKYDSVKGDSRGYEGTDLKTSPYEWVVKNKIKRHKETGKEYVVLCPVKKAAHSRVSYILTTPEGITNTVDELTARLYTVESYWRTDYSKYIQVSLDNILLIK